MQINRIFCIYSLVQEHLDCFQIQAITSKAAMNIVEDITLWHGEASFRYMLKSGIAESSGRSISIFLRKLQIDFQSGCTSLQSHQQWSSVLLFPPPCHHVLPPEVLILEILISVKWNLRGVLIWISLITKDFEHFFMCFSAKLKKMLATKLHALGSISGTLMVERLKLFL